jgi:hypothetical protein
MIYVLITTCLILTDFEIRQFQYTLGINCVKQYFTNYKIIIIENNGKRDTFLNNFDLDVFYTDNNKCTTNKGATELKDINDCIYYYKIKDDDFIIKITGRYLLHQNSNFVNHIKNIDNYDCLIQYGSFINPQKYKINDCITGLIGMKCKYIKQIEYPLNHECVEWNWAKVTYTMQDDKICILDGLGIYICPGSNNYYLV